ncbi:hypothetical protein CWM47_32565 [Spirosoma pollinicola]|uniref:Uncharacterized protein n=1 Tax=Spirosoma pollinicola TaxID=2057025 RepID=A0A2K8Z8I3_9BACT|nr:hypothetical protein CWM47_32565 [Spirosoma pollinicola]
MPGKIAPISMVYAKGINFVIFFTPYHQRLDQSPAKLAPGFWHEFGAKRRNVAGLRPSYGLISLASLPPRR